RANRGAATTPPLFTRLLFFLRFGRLLLLFFRRLLRAFRLGGGLRALLLLPGAGVVGDIPAAPLEVDGRRREGLLQLASAVGADLQRLLADPLQDLGLPLAGLADVFVERHVSPGFLLPSCTGSSSRRLQWCGRGAAGRGRRKRRGAGRSPTRCQGRARRDRAAGSSRPPNRKSAGRAPRRGTARAPASSPGRSPPSRASGPGAGRLPTSGFPPSAPPGSVN